MTKPNDFFDELEIMSPKERESYLNRHLAEAIKHAYHHAEAAKEILDRAGVSPTQIRTIKDLEKLPITRKTDLIELQKAKPPYGGFLAIPPEEVERVVKETIRVAAPGGGYVLSTCNTLIRAIPPANALAMYRAGDKWGRYPIGDGND